MTSPHPDLFAWSPPPRNWRRTDPDTSRKAGESARHFIGEHHRKILDVLRRTAVPLAAEQIADELGWRGGRILSISQPSNRVQISIHSQ